VIKKGGTKRINAESSILLGRTEMAASIHELRHRAAKAIVDALGKLEAMRGAGQVECSRIAPFAHDGKTANSGMSCCCATARMFLGRVMQKSSLRCAGYIVNFTRIASTP